MNKVCDFTAQSGNGAHKLTQLVYENECLRQEVAELKNELSSTSDKVNSQSESISSLQSKIEEIKESYSTNLVQHSEQVTQQVEHQKELFNTAVGMYENWSIGISLFVAIGGLATLFFIKQYKTILNIDPSRHEYLLKIGEFSQYPLQDNDKALKYFNKYSICFFHGKRLCHLFVFS